VNYEQALDRAYDILSLSKYVTTDKQLTPNNFREFASLVADVIRYELSPQTLAQLTWLKDWVDPFKALCDDFERLVKLDPMTLYRPLTPMHLAFEKSQAFVRYAHCAIGTGKTTLGYKCIRDRMTGRDWKGDPVQAGHCAIISVGLGTYAETVFKRKFLDGDPHDILTPIFPDGGAWFSDYNTRTNTIYIACRACKEAGRPKSCTHQIQLRCFSQGSNIAQLRGPAYAEILLDEPVEKEWFTEAAQRVRRGQALQGRISITGTAYAGTKQWEYTDLVCLPPHLNKRDPADPKSPPYVDVFTISKRDTGLYSEADLAQMKLEMSDSEYEAFVNGKMVAVVDSPVFNYRLLDALEKACTEPQYGDIIALSTPTKERPERLPIPIEAVERAEAVVFVPEPQDQLNAANTFTGLRLWELPQPRAQYLISADVGLGQGEGKRKSDPSSATVWKLVTRQTPNGPRVAAEEVAKYFGWITVFPYADKLKLLGVWYNEAVIVPETTGVGHGLMSRLVDQLVYPNVFRDNRPSDQAPGGNPMSASMGIDTNVRTKSLIVMAIKEMMRAGLLHIRDAQTIQEMRAYEETVLPAGGRKYGAGGGGHDDRVMDVGLMCYAVLAQGDLLISFMNHLSPDMIEQPLTDAQRQILRDEDFLI
jgi:hypothetical protein